ncbi:MAG TPA: hypothetical protein VGT60_05485 [Candidatus Limnocylindria bacterium]|nr:hypothetical protein [Candidatus Limnocylindria bacterium]
MSGRRPGPFGAPAVSLLWIVALSLAFPFPAAASTAGSGFDSRYAGESVFTSRPAGQTGQFSAIFFNAGTQAWAPGVVGLMVCLADQTTCGVPSPNAAYASSWYSPTVYATVTAPVSPGQNGFFVYDFAVPAGTPPNTVATFNGDVGLLSSGALLHPEGYFQQNVTPVAAGPATVASFDPDPIAADGVSITTLTVSVLDRGAPNPIFASTPITVTRQGGLAFCALTGVTQGANGTLALDGTTASASGNVVTFTVASTTLPGTCLLAITTGDLRVAGTTAALTTRVVGPGTTLAVSSGGGAAHPAAVAGSCTIAGVRARNNDDPSCVVVTVDVLDLNGLRVTGDNTRVITATLDPTTCAGGPGGPVALQGSASTAPSAATSTAAGGRATFVFSSHGPYAGCRITFTSPFLSPASTTEAWSA